MSLRTNKGLITGAHDGKIDLVQNAIADGANINDNSELDNFTALHYAAQNGHSEIVDLLLMLGANVNATTSYGNTPLHQACIGDHVECVKLLLNAGARRDVINRDNYFPSDMTENKEILSLLIGKGCDQMIGKGCNRIIGDEYN